MRLKQNFDLAVGNDPKIDVIFDEQKSMANALFTHLQKENTSIVAQGPLGMGKSLVISVVAASLSEEGKKVLICSPTYSHAKSTIRDTFRKIERDPPILYGVSRYFRKFGYICPLRISNKTDHQACNKCNEEDCRINRDQSVANESSIVLTSHALLVSRSSIASNFDVIIIDECHGYPDVVRNADCESVTHDAFVLELEKLKNFSSLGKTVKSVQTMYEKLSKTGKEYWETKLQTGIKNLGKMMFSTQVESTIFSYTDRISEVKSRNGRFYITRRRHKPKYEKNLSIGLVSAIIEDPLELAKECEFGDRIFAPPFVVKSLSDRFRNRFDNRPVYALLDGPNLKVYDSGYKTLRHKANRIIKNIALKFTDPILILCRNENDAKSIQNTLLASESLSERIFLCDSISEKDLDEFEGIVNSHVKEGGNVVIATASSRLWEGANIIGLKLLIIDALPYRRPSPEETSAGLRGWYKSPVFRFMLRRLQQGIGRLVREDGDWGIVVIVDGRLYSGGKRILNRLPAWIVGEHIFRWTLSENISSEVLKIRNTLRKGKSARRIKRLDLILKGEN